MFTGIVQAIGRVTDVQSRGDDLTLEFDAGGLSLTGLAPGDSIAVNGVCLTATTCTDAIIRVDVSAETLSRTLLGAVGLGTPLNLELSLGAGAPMGGHLVTGHVDGLGVLVRRERDGRSERMGFALPRSLAPYVAEKGSVCLDGVSLTINSVADSPGSATIDVNIIPHTLEVTTLGRLAPDDRVHVEVDLVARYVNRWMQLQSGTIDQ